MDILKTATVGFWWRFSTYTVADGYIRPAKGAELEKHYDPWEEYRAAQEGYRPGDHGKRSMQTPYKTLIDLIDEHARRKGHPASYDHQQLTRPSAAFQDAIAAWCGKHGLLGLALHRTRIVRLAARWEPSNPHSKEPGRQLLPTAREYVRRSHDWEQRNVSAFGGGRTYLLDKHSHLQGQLVKPDDLFFNSPDGFADVLTDVRSFDSRQEPLGLTWARFFPNVPREQHGTYEYCQPLTTQFWQEYAEPLHDFIHAAFGLLDTVAGLASLKGLKKDRIAKLSQEETLRYQRSHYAMAALVAPVSPFPWMPDPVDGTISELWACPSLLTSFAKMALQDLDARRVFRCEVCEKLAVSSALRASYCSVTCRNTAAKRRQRKSKKQNQKNTRRKRRAKTKKRKL